MGLVSYTVTAIERWTPIVVVLDKTNDLQIVYKSGSLRFVIYDEGEAAEEQWMPFYSENSAVVANGGGRFTATILPNGGWSSENFTLKFLDSEELE